MASVYCRPCCFFFVSNPPLNCLVCECYPCDCCLCMCGETYFERQAYCDKFLKDIDMCCCFPCQCINNIVNCPCNYIEDRRKHELALLKEKNEHELKLNKDKNDIEKSTLEKKMDRLIASNIEYEKNMSRS